MIVSSFSVNMKRLKDGNIEMDTSEDVLAYYSMILVDMSNIVSETVFAKF